MATILRGKVESKGFGDTIEKITVATGIKKIVDKTAEALGIDDCGCEERKRKLNDPNLAINKIFYNNDNK